MTALTLTAANMSGQLYRLRTGKPFAQEVSAIAGVKQIRVYEPHGWGLYQWTTDAEVTTASGNSRFEPGNDGSRMTGSYFYMLLIREVEDRFMILSNHGEVVQQFIIRHHMGKQLERPIIDVATIVKDAIFPEDALERRGGQYRIGALYANVEGFGRSFRTISLFGDDLANATLTRTILPHLNPYRATLRDIKSDSEVLSVGAKGEISFYFRGRDSLTQVDLALAYMRKNNYMSWRTKR